MSSNVGRRVRYSQNFLHSRRLVDHLVRRSTIDSDDVVVEIGPGRGIITERLARSCHQVLAIEKDSRLAAQLRTRFADSGNVVVFAADFLSFRLPLSRYKIFASIPFNITSAIITKVTGLPFPVEDAYLVVQREAAAKLLGEGRESLAAILLKPWFEPTILHHFQRDDFTPPPQVEVVLLRLRKRGPPMIASDRADSFRDFVVYLFSSWKPTVRAGLHLFLGRRTVRHIEQRVRHNLNQPPTHLQFHQWLDLFSAFQALGDERAARIVVGAEARLRQQQSSLSKEHRTRIASARR